MPQNIGKLLLKGMKQAQKQVDVGLRDAVLSRDVVTGPRMAGQRANGPQTTPSSWPCKAIIEVATARNVGDTLVGQAERKIGIFGASLPSGVAPKDEDKITIADIDGVSKTFRLIAPVNGDGSGGSSGGAAYFEFAARK